MWLSRGLFEALIAFIGRADSDQWALRAAVYEFTQPDVLAAFKAAHDSGADVKVLFHDHDNMAAWTDANNPFDRWWSRNPACIPCSVRATASTR